jgi:hypothetical protein
MLTPKDKADIVTDCFVNQHPVTKAACGGRRGAGFGIYAWRPGSDDVKLIFAIDAESAARIAVRARIDGGMAEQEALEHVTTRDLLAEIDLADLLFQGEAPLWNGPTSRSRTARRTR